jgi:hypothetical protein
MGMPTPGSQEWEDMVDFMRADLANDMGYTKIEMAARKIFVESGRDFDAEFKAYREGKTDPIVLRRGDVVLRQSDVEKLEAEPNAAVRNNTIDSVRVRSLFNMWKSL